MRNALFTRSRLLMKLLHSDTATTQHPSRLAIGIRREDPLRIWERRCPLTPEAVEALIAEEDVDVFFQPCERRIFTAEQFIKAGAKPHKTLAPAHIILGIKETPLHELLTDPVQDPRSDALVPRTHVMFSHTIKGQTYNMPLLSRFLHDPSTHGRDAKHAALLPTLVDWELLTDMDGKRTVGFGWYAGVAGTLEGLNSTAHLHLQLGVASPFLSTPRPHSAHLPQLRQTLRRIGEQIAKDGTPASMGPYIVCVTGNGQVANGALSLLAELPVQMVSVAELPSLVSNPSTPLNKIYVLHAGQETYLKRKDGGTVSRKDYYAYPTAYESRFYEMIAPYTTLLINGVGWVRGYPRLMTTSQTALALEKVQKLSKDLAESTKGSGSHSRDVMKGRSQSFADISCDIEGGLEFMPHESTLSEPFYSHKPAQFPAHLPALQIMSVDILPTSLPLDASQEFSAGVLPYIRALVRKYKHAQQTGKFEGWDFEIAEAVERATVASGGRLIGKNTWLQDLVDKYRSSLSQTVPAPSAGLTIVGAPRPGQKKILMLGSGMVSGPVVDAICRRKDVHLTIASDQPDRNISLCNGRANATSVTVDMADIGVVDELVKKSDVVISLLPVPFHPAVAELCVKHHRHLVTASYISPDMRKLHDRAVKANVLLLNEIGLDPGIDHCSALALLDSIRQEKKDIVSFTSFCGGMPAPEDADVPLRYKFSWSPRGVLNATLNDAQFQLGGKEFSVPSDQVLRSKISNLPVSDVLQLEGIPNRNSLNYADTYDLHPSKGVQTLFRGTIRFPGFCDLMYAFRQIGLLDTDQWITLRSWPTLAHQALAAKLQKPVEDDASFRATAASLVPAETLPQMVEALAWLTGTIAGPDATKLPAIPSTPEHPIDLLASLLATRLSYAPHERDLVVLHHEVISSSPGSGGKRDEIHTSSLEVYGDTQHSAMARCVGLPVAFAALYVLNSGHEHAKGVHGPVAPHLYTHILKKLEGAGLRMKHTVTPYVEGRGVEARLRNIW